MLKRSVDQVLPCAMENWPILPLDGEDEGLFRAGGFHPSNTPTVGQAERRACGCGERSILTRHRLAKSKVQRPADRPPAAARRDLDRVTLPVAAVTRFVDLYRVR